MSLSPSTRDDRGAVPIAGRRRDSAALVRPEFGPTLPVLLRRQRPRWLRPSFAGLAVLAAIVIAALALASSAGSERTDATLLHRQPDFSLLFAAGDLRRVEPAGDAYAHLVARGKHVEVDVTVRPLPRLRGAEPTLSDLPIVADLMVEDRQRLEDAYTVLEEGRGRLNDATGYQVRWRSGPDSAPVFGHDVLLVPEPPLAGPGLLVSLRQHNARPRLGPDDRRLAYLGKRAFRSLRFGTERP